MGGGGLLLTRMPGGAMLLTSGGRGALLSPRLCRQEWREAGVLGTIGGHDAWLRHRSPAAQCRGAAAKHRSARMSRSAHSASPRHLGSGSLLGPSYRQLRWKLASYLAS